MNLSAACLFSLCHTLITLDLVLVFQAVPKKKKNSFHVSFHRAAIFPTFIGSELILVLTVYSQGWKNSEACFILSQAPRLRDVNV